MKVIKMNKELEIFATTLNEIAKNMPDSFWLYRIETGELVDKLINENKNYEYIYDEDDEIQDTVFKGYKDEKLNKVLEIIKKSLDKDNEKRNKDRDSLDEKVFNNLKSMKSILKIYAINTKEK